MARPKDRDRQFTLYFRSAEEKKRLRKLAKPYTLTKWILLTIDQAVDAPPKPNVSDDINALRAEVVNLRKENTLLATKLDRSNREIADLRTSREPMEAQMRDLIRLFANNTGVLEPSEILAAMVAETGSGTGAARIKSINKYLEQLEDSDLITKTQRGWKWQHK
jgi:hypothetical protein